MSLSSETSEASAAVMARLWGALAREPFPAVVARRRDGSDLVVRLADGREIRGDAAAAEPFARPANLAVDGITNPGELVTKVFGGAAATLRMEIDNSVANLAAARAAQPAPDGGQPVLSRAPDLVYLEQSVVDGHPLHPLCRTRSGMSPEENRAYGPEFRPLIPLEVVAVPPDRWLATGAGLPPKLPVHPWQRDHVLDRHPELRPTGETIPARPLMSLRTLARADDPRWHLKTSVDVQMTSARRIVSPAAVHNGPLLSQLLRDLCQHEPIEILAEVAAGAVLVDGEPSRSLATVLRRAPALQDGEIALPFAVLSAPSPASGRAYAVEAAASLGPRAFFGQVAALAVPPVLRLLHRGAALEAHGQNLLLVLDGGRPVRLCYRDMGGVRVSARRLARSGIAAPPLHGDIPTEDDAELRAKVIASLISTVMGQLIATLASETGAEPDRMWADLAAVVRAAAQPGSHGAGDVAAILGETLPIKATTAMRLAAQPLEDLWAPIRNPMAGT
jgi:staphyloferrin A synthase